MDWVNRLQGDPLTDSESVQTYAEAYSRYVDSLKRLESMGYRINPTSRLKAYEVRLGVQAQAVEVGIMRLAKDNVVELSLITREADELIEIISTLPADPALELRERIKRLTEGSLTPDGEKGSPSREAQFELFLWTQSKRARLKRRLGLPVIVVPIGGHELAIEAKRPASIKRVEDTLRDAASALEAHKGPRMI